MPPEARYELEPLLEESFEGMYLWHSRRTLANIDVVKKATLEGRPVGLAMLKMLEKGMGYVYYVAVSRDQRGRGIGGFLLDRSIEYFFRAGAEVVFAAAEEDNAPSLALFKSRKFAEISYSQMGRKYGRLSAARLWGRMLVVPGELLMYRGDALRERD